MKTFFLRITLFFCVGMFMSVSATQAQRFGNAEERSERAKAHVEEILLKLELEDEQAEQVKEILLAQSEQQGTIMETYAGQRDRDSMGKMREEMQDLQKTTAEKLSGLLSEEKMEMYEATVAEIQERNRGQFRGRRSQGSPNE